MVRTVLGCAVVLLLAACGAGGTAPASGPSSRQAGVGGTITVFAAASLQEAFTTLGTQFEQANPGTTVRLSFGPSPGLAQQILQGAPADVFASASPTNLAQVRDADLAGAPTTFATNVMAIAVPPGNPAKVTTVADLARPGVTVALCQPQVPCGAVTAQVLDKAHVSVQPVSQEADVKSVLAKVSLDEVDAGVVYVTDVRAAGDRVVAVPIPDDLNASTAYPIATLTASANPVTARAFTDYVLSAGARAVLADAGFAVP